MEYTRKFSPIKECENREKERCDETRIIRPRQEGLYDVVKLIHVDESDKGQHAHLPLLTKKEEEGDGEEQPQHDLERDKCGTVV